MRMALSVTILILFDDEFVVGELEREFDGNEGAGEGIGDSAPAPRPDARFSEIAGKHSSSMSKTIFNETNKKKFQINYIQN